MKKAVLLIGIYLVAGVSTAAAETSGRIIMAPYFDISQRVLFSQNDYVFGTSRSAAMGGAFTSLGADLSSMNINPAGLGMYQSSDWGITQGLSIASINTGSPRMDPGNITSGGTRTTYGLDNVGIVFNTFNRSSNLTSLSFGFSYNRMANFNSRSFVETYGNDQSIADMFFNQLSIMKNGNILPSDLTSSARPFENNDIFLDEFGAVLGYQTGVVDYANGNYTIPLSRTALTDSYMQSVTRGGMYDYTFSIGANINNIVYLGATMGISQLLYKEALTYEESYRGQGNDQLKNMWYDQNTTINGVGYTMKLGAVIRPVTPLRIGVAFHLPTYYTLNKYYTSEMGAFKNANSGRLEDEQRFNTAPRLLAGLSYVIADRAVVSVDYECTWYNGIRSRNIDLKEEERVKAESKQYLKPGHTVKAGLEVLLTDAVSLRAGGGYQANFMRDKKLYDTGEYLWPGNTPTSNSSYNITGGVGFNLGRNAYIDVAYIFRHLNYANYDYYYLRDGERWSYQYDNGADGQKLPREYSQTKNFHLISLTFGCRF